MADSADNLKNDYLAESSEHLADIETDLLAIEARGANIDEELVNQVFRAAHSVKGGAAFFDLKRIGELAHKTENVLQMIRSRQMVPDSAVINVLLRAFDKLREMIHNPDESEQTDTTEYVQALVGLTSAHLPAEKKGSIARTVDLSIPGGKGFVQLPEFDLVHAKECGHHVYLLKYDLIHDVQRIGKTPLDVFRNLIACGSILDCTFDLQSVGTLDDEVSNVLPLQLIFSTLLEPNLVSQAIEISGERTYCLDEQVSKIVAPLLRETVVVTPSAPAPVVQVHAPSAEVKGGTVTAKETTLRVSVDLLETLMNLAGELVLSRNQLTEAIARSDARAVTASGQHISLVTSELQEAIMMTRMQPIGNVFSKFPRVVRDLALALHKDVQLDISGKDVEMDKTIIEGLSDPLTHMVRNSVDHGIESPAVRTRAGKPSSGTVKLNAYHQAGQVVIEIRDDGKGIDVEKVSETAVSKGLLTREQLKGMSEKDKFGLIFLPGLSTAEKVTDVSGRGVGMDVVKTNLDRLGGKVEIESEPGKGTLFRIKMPLTLAIIPSLLVSIGEERFAIPQVNVSELIRIPAEQVKKRIELVGSASVLILRGSLIPIVRLSDVLGIERTYFDPEERAVKPDRRERIADRRSMESEERQSTRLGDGRRYHAQSDLSIVIVNSGTFRYGLVVDQLHDTMEIVLKPLGRHLKKLREYAGAAIMGDGLVALILDIAGIAAKVGLTSMAGTERARELSASTDGAAAERGQDIQSLLLFRNAPDEQCAVSLGLVERVEQISDRQIESIGGKRTMQYRGATLPLVALEDVAKVAPLTSAQDRVVIVFAINGREVGLLAAKPLDVIETTVSIDQTTIKQPGVMGSGIIRDFTTMMVDIFELVETAHPEWSGERVKATFAGPEAPVILLAEDSEFFRNQLRKFLEGDGFQVKVAENGQQAWELLQENAERICLVVTDIEMPQMNGLALAEKIRADQRFARLPIIAVTSLAGEQDVAKGKAAGIDDYQVKLDKERLLTSIREKMATVSPGVMARGDL